MMSDLRLVAIASPPFVAPHTMVEACRAVERGGATAVQVRLKHASAAELLEVSTQLVTALSIPVYVNDRADVALAAGAHGVHLGADDVDPIDVRAMAPRPFRLGVSVGTPVEAAAARRADVDYWSCGSIYATGTKSDAGTPIGPEGFRALARLAPRGMPVLAIGGVTSANAPAVLRAGASGIAVISAIFGAPDIAAATRVLRAMVDAELQDERADYLRTP
jgi:thiamine-phosphate pyrophosphorylase